MSEENVITVEDLRKLLSKYDPNLPIFFTEVGAGRPATKLLSVTEVIYPNNSIAIGVQ